MYRRRRWMPLPLTMLVSPLTLLPLIVILIMYSSPRAHGRDILAGVHAMCDTEGEPIELPWASPSCMTCKCKGGHIECEQEVCLSSQGCFMVLVEEKKKCCPTCKGCTYNGTSYSSGSKWLNPSDPCQSFHCLAGVITVFRQQCYSTCRQPQPPMEGHCCAHCKGCHLSGLDFVDGDEFVLESDRCVNCKCYAGRLVCSKQVCPVLSCPQSKIIHKSNNCCPECQGVREVYDWPKRCLFDNRMLSHGQQFSVDNCTSCVCNGSTSICKRESCVALQCAPELQVLAEGECCPTCAKQEVISVCMVAGKKYKEGESWKPKPCTTCDCWRGKPRCFLEKCNTPLQCPTGYKVHIANGQCCPKCIQEEAVCTVFGDPHYRTFDRRVYNFQGPCKYVLSQDCSTGLFSITVRNDHRGSALFSWTKSLMFKVNGTKVALLQKMKVKVNGNRVSPPYTLPGILTITLQQFTLTVKTQLGVSVVWDGDSFLEVSVASSFANKLCGLCGNYNREGRDDYRMRNGAQTSDTESFGRSWRVGGKRQCSRAEVAAGDLKCPRRDEERSKGSEACGPLRTGVFRACHQTVSPHRYMAACLLDTCHCPANASISCACQAFTAYAHECARKGVSINWRNETTCTGVKCGKGRVYSGCMTSCPATCSNLNATCPKTTDTNSSTTKAVGCVAGCECAKGRLLHHGRCIKQSDCPANT